MVDAERKADGGWAMNDESRHRDTLLRFVEQFALLLSEAGWPRMPARVFAYALADDADRYTANELAEGLGVSTAAISGAVRYLTQTGLLGKERAPGARSDSYRLYDDDVWLAITNQRTPMLKRWKEGLAVGIEAIGTRSRGGRRLMETVAFLDFMERELPALMVRWHQERKSLFNPD
jgi:predicted transcriptional regulator